MHENWTKKYGDDYIRRLKAIEAYGVKCRWEEEGKMLQPGARTSPLEPVRCTLGSLVVIEPFDDWPSDELVGRMALAYEGGQRNEKPFYVE